MVSQEIIEEIRQKADIVQIISSYINVIKKGNSYVAVCPFHNDKNPSLQISQSKQIFKCFSCGKGGNVFTFVQDYEKITFLDAVKKVANLIGFHSDELEKQNRFVNENAKLVLSALKEANQLYSFTLKTDAGKKGYEYLKKRNISDEMSNYFSLGYCPEDGEISIKFLRAKNISIEDLDKAGIISRDNNRFVDRFRGRLIFPLYNEYNEVVGFSARRIVDNDEAKYVNSINNDVFNKSKVLYNYQNALNEAKNAGYVYVTEGFMDVFSLYQVGIKSAVALMGTAFTLNHAKLLKHLNCEVRLCLDGDEAGQHGMLAMIDILDKEKIKYRIVNYKDCQLDPDEILQKYGEKVLAKFLNRLFTRDDFVFQYYSKKYDLKTSEGKRDFSNQILLFTRKIENPIDREIILKKLSDLTGISYQSYSSIVENQIKDDQKNKDVETEVEEVVKPNKKVLTRLDKVQDEILRLMINSDQAIEEFNRDNNYFYDNICSLLGDYIIDCYSREKKFDSSELITILSQKDDQNSKNTLNKLIDLQEINSGINYSSKLMEQYLKILKKETSKMEREKIIANAEKEKSVEEQALIIQKELEKRRK